MATGGCHCRLLVVPYFGCDYRVGADFFGRWAFKPDRCVAAATCGGADSGGFRGSRGLLRRRVSFPSGMDEPSDQLIGPLGNDPASESKCPLSLVYDLLAAEQAGRRWFQLRDDVLRYDFGDVPDRWLDPGDGLEGAGNFHRLRRVQPGSFGSRSFHFIGSFPTNFTAR